jgi:hypothetical protein
MTMSSTANRKNKRDERDTKRTSTHPLKKFYSYVFLNYKIRKFINILLDEVSMAEFEEEKTSTDSFEEKPEELRDNDEIDDAEEAFMEGYEEDSEDEEEEEEKEDFEG